MRPLSSAGSSGTTRKKEPWSLLFSGGDCIGFKELLGFAQVGSF